MNPEQEKQNETGTPETPQQVQQEETSSPPQPLGQTHWGTLLGIVIVVAVIVVGGLYILNEQRESFNEMTIEEIVSDDPVLEDLTTQSSSDELPDIEDDLDTTELDALLDDLDNIDAEL